MNDISKMSPDEKRKMLAELLRKKSSGSSANKTFVPQDFEVPEDFKALKKQMEQLEANIGHSIYFQICDGTNTNVCSINNKEYINYSGYNYLGLSGHPSVNQAAKEAIDTYGTSVSASRLAAGERSIHQELEKNISDFLGTEDCLAFIGGYVTNESVIGHLCNSDDLIIYDSLIHASIQTGSQLSGATIKAFPHNNYTALNQILLANRSKYKKVLIVIEGVYSMDGDIPNLPEFIEIKKRHKAMLLVDEAHSLGVLGEHGAGISEYYKINVADVDFWMGTLSKSLASCGGYIAGKKEMIEYLQFSVPGFVYSVGMTPANTAAANAALNVLQQEPERVKILHQKANLFLTLAKQAGLNTGDSKDSAVVPIITGDSKTCVGLYKMLYDNGVFALPIVYPTVAENAARIRFFISNQHTEEQIQKTVGLMSNFFQK